MSETKCPRCGEGYLRDWDELTEEERMIARRLPENVDYTSNEREAMHRWCTNCWHEATADAPCET